MTHRRLRITMGSVGALVLGLLSATVAGAANTTVYRCLDSHLDVVYTDVPCKEGTGFEVNGGEADPAALTRLQQMRDSLDQAAAQRLSQERQLAAQRIVPVPVASEAEPEDGSGYGPYYTYPVEGYAPYHQHEHRHRDRDRARVDHRFAHRGAPSPPYIVPRHF